MQVGPFRLERCIGKGGMGEVWLARHAGGVAAALKFDLNLPTEAHREEFLHEVRLVAGLDHPNCVLVFDAGVVPANTAAGGGPVVAGAPWLAMELAPGGSVGERPPKTWEETLHVFRGLLLGLAHAHARGVVHRDIKPGNLLLAGPRGVGVEAPPDLLASRVVLSDFGVGTRVDRPGTLDGEAVGTPRYMAPEQVEARWRDQGPWTDLYQSGVMLWRLVTGTFPFRQTQAYQLYFAHLHETPGDFRPQFDVPAGLEECCRTLMAKKPEDRPAFALDALSRLEALGAVRAGSGRGGVAVDADLPTLLAADGRTPSRSTTRRTGAEDGAALDMRLRGAGLGLWGLRPVPLVARDEARATLWEALVEVRRSRRAAVVVLTGPQGSGKSRLAAWLAEQAHESAEATTWRARHTGDPDDGLQGMFRAELRLQGLDREAALERLRVHGPAAEPLVRWLVDDDRRALADADRFALAARVLAATDRPRVVWLDDAHASPDTLRFVAHALDRLARPVLFVLTARDEELAQDPALGKLLAKIVDRPGARKVEVGPLAPDDHRALVRGMLGLDGPLAVEVERRTAGNPRFAVELVNGWVEQGVLEPGPRGLKLRAGATAAVPADLVAVWAARVERFAAAHTPADLAAVELAATLGVELTADEWRAACGHAGLLPRAGLLDELLGTRLLRADDRRRLRFAHALLREQLLESARRAGRERGHCLACAEALAETPGADERRGLLLFRAGRHEEAFEPLCRALDQQLGRADHRSTELLEVVEAIPKLLSLPKEDARWGEVWNFRAWHHRQQGRTIEADELLARTERAAKRHGWKAQLGIALRDAGRTAMRLGELRDALDSLTRAEALLAEVGRTETAGDCRMAMGDVELRLGHLDRAEELFRSAIGCFDTPRGQGYAAMPYASLASLYQKRGELDLAEVWVRKARVVATLTGRPRLLAQMANLEGEIARSRGDLDGAERSYHDAVRAYELLYDEEGRFPVVNLGLVRVLLGRHQEARAMVLPLLEELQQAGTEAILAAYCSSVLLPAAAGCLDLEGFDRHLRELDVFLASSGLADPDIATLCGLAAELVADPDRAAGARRIAAEQRRRLGG